MQIIKNSEIASKLRQIDPKRIAVAYVGIEWEKFVNLDKNCVLICSPTLGSNPWAIEDIVKKIEWNRVYFLNELHAKIYIGEKSAAIGSFNLSMNGLGGKRLEELGVFIEEEDALKLLGDEFLRILGLAKNQYKTDSSKIKRLEYLRKITKNAISNGVATFPGKPTRLKNYNPIMKIDFYVAWYFDRKLDIDYERVENSTSEITEENFQDKVKYYFNFLEDDPIEEGNWLLAWEVDKNGNLKEKSFWWFYVDSVISHGAKDGEYTKLVLQFKDRPSLPEPFALDDRVQEALGQVIVRDEFKSFRPTKEWSKWSVKPSLRHIDRFVEETKRLVK